MVHPGQPASHRSDHLPRDRGAGPRHIEGADSLACLLADEDELVVDRDCRPGHVGHVGHHRVHRHGAHERDADPPHKRLGPVRPGPRPTVAIADRKGRDLARAAGREARAVADPAARRQVDDADRPGVQREDRLELGRDRALECLGGQVVGRQAVQGQSDPDSLEDRAAARQQPGPRAQVAAGSGRRPPRAGRWPGQTARPGPLSERGRSAPGGATRPRPAGRRGLLRSGRPWSPPRMAGSWPVPARSRARGGARAGAVRDAGRMPGPSCEPVRSRSASGRAGRRRSQ